jgi:multiple sugar transport system ATP-binding protein
MASVEIEDVRKSAGKHEILKGISAKVADGQFAVLVGPSGCGKSTLLRLIAGLDTPTHGIVRIDGQVVNHLRPRERDIAMVFQSYALYPHMTVADNMGFALKLQGQSRSEIDAAVNRVAKTLSLEQVMHRLPRELSGGQRQRVAMGRAIVRNPKAFLFDEPLSNLDAKLRVQMRAEIKSLHNELRSTSIYVTHDQLEAMTMADVIIVMREGRIEQMGTPGNVYDDPDNLFVAEFIGSPAINLLKGVKEGARFKGPGGFEVACPVPVADHTPLVCGVRPEMLGPARDSNSGFSMTIGLVENTGPDINITGKVGDSPLRAVLGRGTRVTPGTTMRLEVTGLGPLFFNPQTGQRVRPAVAASVAA